MKTSATNSSSKIQAPVAEVTIQRPKTILRRNGKIISVKGGK